MQGKRIEIGAYLRDRDGAVDAWLAVDERGCGVYVIFSENGQTLYVGKTTQHPIDRLDQHIGVGWRGGTAVTTDFRLGIPLSFGWTFLYPSAESVRNLFSAFPNSQIGRRVVARRNLELESERWFQNYGYGAPWSFEHFSIDDLDDREALVAYALGPILGNHAYKRVTKARPVGSLNLAKRRMEAYSAEAIDAVDRRQAEALGWEVSNPCPPQSSPEERELFDMLYYADLDLLKNLATKHYKE